MSCHAPTWQGSRAPPYRSQASRAPSATSTANQPCAADQPRVAGQPRPASGVVGQPRRRPAASSASRAADQRRSRPAARRRPGTPLACGAGGLGRPTCGAGGLRRPTCGASGLGRPTCGARLAWDAAGGPAGGLTCRLACGGGPVEPIALHDYSTSWQKGQCMPQCS